jgi:hypothetical protein
MREILILTIITGVFFISFIAILVLGLLKKKRKLIIASVTVLFCSVGLASWTGYTFLKKSINKVTGALKPRSGEEIYKALFGQDESGCVRVTNSQDQIIPKIDVAIWLKFETCPAELKRILSRHPFEFSKIETASWAESIPYGEPVDWLNPQLMGDTIFVYEYSSEDSRNIQTLWTSRDSTRVLCRDIFD